MQVPEEVVEGVWRGMAAGSASEACRWMQPLASKQGDLLAFVFGYTHDLRPRARELGVYLHLVIVKMFDDAFEGRLDAVSAGRIEEQLQRNEDLLEGLDCAHERFVERIALTESARQPHVMRYLAEALLEDDKDDVELTVEEEGLLFFVLKTVIDCLDRVTPN